MPKFRLEVLFEDNHLLVVNKSAGLPVQLGSGQNHSVHEIAKNYIGQKYSKPGAVYLGIVSRLDLPVSGVMVFARTSKAADRLSKQFREKSVQKTYVALVEGTPPEWQELRDYLALDEGRPRIASVASDGAKLAVMSVRRRATQGGQSLLELKPETGRKHQIRIQLGAAGFPIVGDRAYGSRVPFPKGIALHSRELSLEHPTKHEPMTFQAPFPTSWNPAWLAKLGL